MSTVIILVSVLLTGCGQPTHLSFEPTQNLAPAGEGSPPRITTANSHDQGGNSPYLLLNEKWLEGQFYADLDINDVHQVFGYVFSRLPDHVMVYPTENYYYFILHVNQRQLRGNITLSALDRDQGLLSFGFWEFRESPYVLDPLISAFKKLGESDGVGIEKLGHFTWKVGYEGKAVIFHLNQLPQNPPRQFAIGDDEEFVERVFDESGYQFFLIFNSKSNFFIWVLNEEAPLPDHLEPLAPDFMVGRKSAFVFWKDPEHEGRKVLAAVRKFNTSVNNYYDGPFDQLADNYADEVKISTYMVRAFPTYKGRIDKYGYVAGPGEPSRVSISPYYAYVDNSALKRYITALRNDSDPLHFISRGGKSPSQVPSKTSGSP